MPSTSLVKQRKNEEAALRKRDDLLAKAGITTKWRQQVLRKAFVRLDEQLDATKSVVVDKEAIQVVDNQARLRAIEQVIDFEGVSVGKAQEGGSSGPVQIVFNAPWYQPGPTIGSGEGQVVEGDQPKLLESQET